MPFFPKDPVDTYQTPSRHLVDTMQTLTCHLPDTTLILTKYQKCRPFSSDTSLVKALFIVFVRIGVINKTFNVKLI